MGQRRVSRATVYTDSAPLLSACERARSSEVFPVLLTLKQVDIYLDCNDGIARAKFLRIGVAFWMRQNSERQRRRLAKKEPSY